MTPPPSDNIVFQGPCGCIVYETDDDPNTLNVLCCPDDDCTVRHELTERFEAHGAKISTEDVTTPGRARTLLKEAGLLHEETLIADVDPDDPIPTKEDVKEALQTLGRVALYNNTAIGCAMGDRHDLVWITAARPHRHQDALDQAIHQQQQIQAHDGRHN